MNYTRKFRPRRERAGLVTAGILVFLALAPGSVAWAQPAAPTLVSPTGPITTPNPLYTWTPVGGSATQYHIWIEQLVDGVWTFKYQFWYTPGQACSGTICTAMPTAVQRVAYYRWYMRAANASGWGGWSSHLGYDVQPLPAPIALTPNGITVPTLTPTFTWSPVAGVVDYYVLEAYPIDTSYPPAYSIWYPAAQACAGGTCSATPPTALAPKTHSWRVLARNGVGPGYWSSTLSFLAAPATWQSSCAGAFLTADFSGDGRTDRLCSAQGVTYVSVTLPTGFPGATPWLLQQFTRPFVGDFDRDGYPDIADLDATGTFRVARSTGTSFTTPTVWGASTACQGVNKIGTGDFDGDGRTDIYCGIPGIGQVYVGRSTGTSFSFTYYGSLTCDSGAERVGVADFNGDGQSDWYCVATNGAFYARLGTGTALDDPSLTSLPASFCAQQNLVLGDLNGDGTTDVVCPANGKVALSTGRALVEQGAWGGFCPGSNTVLAADLEADGVPEVVCNNAGVPANDIEIRRWSGTALGPVQTWRSAWCNASLSVGDFDGDSRMDLLCGDSGHPVVAGTSSRLADLMTTSQNGMGAVTTIAYRPSSDFVNTNNPPVKHVVVSQRVDDGRGGSSTTNYTYAGGKFDRAERRSLGFAWIRAVLPRLQTETASPYVDSTFSQELPSAGRPLTIQRYDGLNQLLTKGEYAYTNTSTLPRTSLMTLQKSYEYDNTGAVRSTQTTFGYDAYGNQSQVIAYGLPNLSDDDLQTDSSYSYNTTAYIVSRVGRVEQRAPGGPALTTVQYEYDNSGNWQVPPIKGDLTAVKRWLAPPGRWATRRFGYNGQGSVTSVTDETNRTITITYDPTDLLFPHTVTNGAGEVETTIWHTLCGQPSTVTDPNNQSVTTTYDHLCRPTRTDIPLGGFVERFYLDFGNPSLQRTRTELPAAPGISGRDWSESYFDGIGRSYRTRKRGPSSTQHIAVHTAYNTRGGIDSTTEPAYEDGGNRQRTTSYEYDALDRVVKELLPGASDEVQTTYEVGSQTTTDPNGKDVTTRFDAFGRVIESERTLNGAPVVTYAKYDRLGRQIETRDAIGNVWTRDFDSLGRVRTDTDPDRGVWTFDYDDAGRPTLQIDAKTQPTTLLYDPQVGRLTQRINPAGTVTYSYGQPSNGYFNVGRLTNVSSPGTALHVDHDNLGRPVLLKRTIGTTNYLSSKAFDNVSGYHISTLYPDGEWVGPFGYDEAGRLKSIAGIVSNVLYDASGRPLERTNANPTTTTWTYSNDRGFLERIRTTFNGSPIQDFGYTPDALGMVQTITSPITSEGWNYNYDDLYRMTSATNTTYSAGTLTLQYDSTGRITYNSRAGGYYTYPMPGKKRPHAPLTVAGSPEYLYDNNGNLTSGGGRAPIWDAEDRITQVGTTQFTYDAFGERVSKVSPSNASIYPFGDDFEITNGIVTKYISVEGQGVIAKRVGIGAAATTYWLHTDHLGSIQSVTDSDSLDLWRSYRPFGETLAQSGAHSESRGWIDQRQDAETSLTYLHARYFDPKLGIFLSPDPAGASLNPFTYASGDSINWSDRSGLQEVGHEFHPYQDSDLLTARLDVEFHNPESTSDDSSTVLKIAGFSGGGGLGLATLIDLFRGGDGSRPPSGGPPPGVPPAPIGSPAPIAIPPPVIISPPSTPSIPVSASIPGGTTVGWFDPLYHTAQFCAGFGDCLTFGGTRYIRKQWEVDDVIDVDSMGYAAGVYTEIGLEVLGTGVSVGLRAAARGVTQEAARRGAKHGVRNVSVMHHTNPLKQGLFPTAALPRSIRHSRINTRLIPLAKHPLAHRALVRHEGYLLALVNPPLTGFRIGYATAWALDERR